jgi:hypothetical protein
MLLIVMLKATTDDTGASSPVVKTCALLFCVVDGELLTPLQPAKLSARASNPATDGNRFISSSCKSESVGELRILGTGMETRVIVGSLRYLRTDYGRNSGSGRGVQRIGRSRKTEALDEESVVPSEARDLGPGVCQ